MPINLRSLGERKLGIKIYNEFQMNANIDFLKPGIFSKPVYDYWHRKFSGSILCRNTQFAVVLNPRLEEDERVILLLDMESGFTGTAITPSVAERLTSLKVFDDPNIITETSFRSALNDIGITLHGADNIYYLPVRDQNELGCETNLPLIRRITSSDAEIFADFENTNSELDLDASQIGIEDWIVLGVTEPNNKLLSAASAYPWRNSALLDIGILTLECSRGQGYGRSLVRAMIRHAHKNNFELQYRCQTDNKTSIALAKSAGLALFGRWEVPTPI